MYIYQYFLIWHIHCSYKDRLLLTYLFYVQEVAMFLKYFEDLWVAITFAEAGVYNNALEEVMKTEELGCECAVIQSASETV